MIATPRRTFVLVHGAWQASWCWRDVAGLLADLGHRAVPIDLPGHGLDGTPLERITLHDYVDAIVAAVGGHEDPPILVGHSLGGVTMQAAERLAGHLRAVVYVAATLPPNGRAMLDTIDGFDPAYLAQFVWADDRRSARISPQGAREYLFTLCAPGHVESILPLLTAEPVGPFETPIWTTTESLARVPAHYVECLRDRAVPIALQRSMYERAGLRRIHTLDTDHSPFFSAPRELVAVLNTIALAGA
jgi:pimeloyl-ACP methyl ester carboxylesterase